MNESSSSILQLGGVFYARCEESIGTDYSARFAPPIHCLSTTFKNTIHTNSTISSHIKPHFCYDFNER